jgi:hypothetical protein
MMLLIQHTITITANALERACLIHETLSGYVLHGSGHGFDGDQCRYCIAIIFDSTAFPFFFLVAMDRRNNRNVVDKAMLHRSGIRQWFRTASKV